ncbi:MAG: hypothetical protein IJB81_03955 [Clostridia bacterium]|nr:hypothetical protein [Clostridia bacterium]
MRTLLRFIALLLTLLCLTPALAEEAGPFPALRGWSKQDGYVYLTLGSFPQTKEGERLPILWRVLTVEEDRALLLSEYILEARPLHGDYKEYANKPTNKKQPGFSGDYTQTDMAKYLNGDFTANFAQGELDALTEDETLGLFFLLSGDELKNAAYGFTSNESRKAWGTEYALANGLFKYMANRGSHSPYWTSTQSTSNTQGARCIKSKGEIGYINVITEDEGMRPACWLRLDQARIDEGDGTREAPYTLLPVPGSDEPIVTELVPLTPATDE